MQTPAQGNSASSAAQENRTSGTDAAQSSTASAEASNKTDKKPKLPTHYPTPEPAKLGRISDAVATLLDIPAAQNASAYLEQQVQPAGLAQGLLYEDAAPRDRPFVYRLRLRRVKEASVRQSAPGGVLLCLPPDAGRLDTQAFGRRGAAVPNAAGAVIYVIPAPYLEDAAGATSDAADYALSPQADGSYLLTVTADETSDE